MLRWRLNRQGTKRAAAAAFLQWSYRSDRDDSGQGFAVFDLLPFGFHADQMRQVLKVEEQQMISKVKERQTLRSDNADAQTTSV